MIRSQGLSDTFLFAILVLQVVISNAEAIICQVSGKPNPSAASFMPQQTPAETPEFCYDTAGRAQQCRGH
jgi:hypothetical protein